MQASELTASNYGGLPSPQSQPEACAKMHAQELSLASNNAVFASLFRSHQCLALTRASSQGSRAIWLYESGSSTLHVQHIASDEVAALEDCQCSTSYAALIAAATPILGRSIGLCARQAQATAQYDVGGLAHVSIRKLAIETSCARVRCCAGARKKMPKRVSKVVRRS